MHQATPQPARPRILIVDDHPANRLAFSTLLEPQYTVTAVSEGRQALEQALREDFAVILLDVKMPVMDGFEVAETLRRRERTLHTPIIFMSAFDQTDLQARKGYVAGATDFVFSPVDGDILKFKVATYSQTYLRNQSLRRGISQLQSTIRALRMELGPKESVSDQIRDRIESLEQQVEELERLMEAP